MKFLMAFVILMTTNLVLAKSKVSLRKPASIESQQVLCTVGDGKEDSDVKTISKPLKKSDSPSIDEVVGDFRIMVQWLPEINALNVGVIEEKSTISSSTIVYEKSKVGSLFVAKNGQSVDLSCYFQ